MEKGVDPASAPFLQTLPLFWMSSTMSPRSIACLAVFFLCAAPAVASEDGTLVVLNKSGASASILDLSSGKELARLETGEGPHEVAISPDGATAVVANYGGQTAGNSLTVLNLAAREVTATIDLGENPRPHGILYLDDQRILVTTEDSQKLLLVNIPAAKIESVMETGGRVGHMVAVTADQSRAFVPHMFSATLACFDLAKGERIALIEMGEQPEGIDIRPGHDEVWVSNRGANSISVVHSKSLEVVATIECGEFPIRLKFTPDGSHALVSNARSGDVAVFNADSRKEVQRIAMMAEAISETDQRLFGDQFEDSPVPVGIVIHPDGKRAYVANTNADVISVLDLENWSLVDRLVAGKEPDGMAWAPAAGGE
jgi:DNA-binding beta-propeller fold protein YncE